MELFAPRLQFYGTHLAVGLPFLRYQDRFVIYEYDFRHHNVECGPALNKRAPDVGGVLIWWQKGSRIEAVTFVQNVTDRSFLLA